ncbi:hypothetical protein BGX28_001204 [Mortierella sp. GBA30]|nr:hypothetical protein BGX28_001204 [Mortierella sp. GBA30]
MADIVVYEDSPLAQYLQDIQGEQLGSDLQHAVIPIHDPGPPPEFIGLRLAHNAFGMLTDLVEYLSHTFSPSSSDSEDAEFEERFKYFICTSPFLNKNVTLSHGERGRRTDSPMTIEYSKFSPGRFGYLGVGTVATLIARSVLARTRVGRLPLARPLLSRSAAVSLALASSAWMLRILASQRRNIQTTQNQALRSLQVLVSQCQALDAKVNRAIMVIQEIELVSRGYRLSTPLAPISRIEQASKTRRCNMVRAQLVAALVKSGALFQKSTETLQSHIDHKRLSTLLDMYHITPSSRPSSPQHGNNNSGNTLTLAPDDNNFDLLSLTASPTSETHSPPWPSSHTPHHVRQNSNTRRRSRTLTGRSSSRPSSYHDLSHPNTGHAEHQMLPSITPGRRRGSTIRRHHTSWSASEGDESDSGGSFTVSVSPRSSTYSNMEGTSPIPTDASPEMTSLERLRKNFQRMHGHRREFLCELLSIRRKSRKGRQGLNALRDYDQNWTVVRDVLQEGVAGIESVVDELSKVLDAELYTLPRIDTQGSSGGNPTQDTQLQPFVHRLALLEQHVRGVQAKLFICNEDIKEAIRQEPTDIEKRRLLELQYDSISQDISMMATEWQFGKTALTQAFDPSTIRSSNSLRSTTLLDENDEMGYDDGGDEQGSSSLGPMTDALEQMEDQQRLMALAARREETWEASTESTSMTDASVATTNTTRAGPKMTRAERIQHQKMLRAQEEIKKERNYDSSRMVHELKDVLGRRRHLRENDDDEPQQQQQHTRLTRESLSLPFIPTRSYPMSEPSEDMLFHEEEELPSREIPIEQISPFLLSGQDISQDLSSFISANTETFSVETMEESYLEITGVGEAEEGEEVDQQHEAEADMPEGRIDPGL